MASLPISEKGYDSHAPSRYTARKIGAANTLEHRIYLEKDGVPVSPFHDVALFANEQQTILNMVVEVPRWTNAKMEVCRHSLVLHLPGVVLTIVVLDLKRGTPQPHQAGHQEGQASLRS